MRLRIPPTLAMLGAATLLAMAIPLPAQASEGVIRFNKNDSFRYENPSGCLPIPKGVNFLDFDLTNETKGPVSVHNSTDCTGPPTAVVPPMRPDQSADRLSGESVNADADPNLPPLIPLVPYERGELRIGGQGG